MDEMSDENLKLSATETNRQIALETLAVEIASFLEASSVVALLFARRWPDPDAMARPVVGRLWGPVRKPAQVLRCGGPKNDLGELYVTKKALRKWPDLSEFAKWKTCRRCYSRRTSIVLKALEIECHDCRHCGGRLLSTPPKYAAWLARQEWHKVNLLPGDLGVVWLSDTSPTAALHRQQESIQVTRHLTSLARNFRGSSSSTKGL